MLELAKKSVKNQVIGRLYKIHKIILCYIAIYAEKKSLIQVVMSHRQGLYHLMAYKTSI